MSRYMFVLLGAALFLTGCGGSDNGGDDVAITDADQIAGSYRAEGTNPPDNQIRYMGDVVVSSQADGTVSVRWVIQTDQWTGVGTITDAGQLFVTYTGAFSGSGTWVLRSDGNLYGTWQQDGFSGTGTEVWLRN